MQRKYRVVSDYGIGRVPLLFEDAASLTRWLDDQAKVAGLFGLVAEFSIETVEVQPNGEVRPVR